MLQIQAVSYLLILLLRPSGKSTMITEKIKLSPTMDNLIFLLVLLSIPVKDTNVSRKTKTCLVERKTILMLPFIIWTKQNQMIFKTECNIKCTELNLSPCFKHLKTLFIIVYSTVLKIVNHKDYLSFSDTEPYCNYKTDWFHRQSLKRIYPLPKLRTKPQ